MTGDEFAGIQWKAKHADELISLFEWSAGYEGPRGGAHMSGACPGCQARKADGVHKPHCPILEWRCEHQWAIASDNPSANTGH